uniref:Uncharacterized protein n=1 Tax=Anopheles arabiensis TaxID=7173 RepID=A0A182IGU1_ANOAR
MQRNHRSRIGRQWPTCKRVNGNILVVFIYTQGALITGRIRCVSASCTV